MKRWLKPPGLQIGLGAILALQIALSVVLFWPRDMTGGEKRRLFPDVSPDDITELTITDNTGTALRLVSRDGEWVLPDAGDFPVLAASVQTVVESIAGLETGRLVTRTEPSHSSLQVADDDFLRQILFKVADGSAHALYLGSSPRYGLTHVRVFGQDEVYLTDALQSWDVSTNAGAWVDTSYVSVPRADLARVTLTNAQGTYAFTQAPGDTEGGTVWSMTGLAEDELLDEAAVSSVVNQAASVNLSTPIGLAESRAFGLDDPNAFITLETSDDTITIVVGVLDADSDSYVVKASTSPYYVRVAKWNLDNLVNYSRDDLLEATPEPLPEEEADAPSSE
jgi:hypothetical protein